MRKGYKIVKGRKIYYNKFNTPRPCIMLDKTTGLDIKEFESINQAILFIRENTKFKTATRDNICNCCLKNRKTAYGYGWRYAKNESNEERG